MKLTVPKFSTAKANERRLILLVKMIRSGEATVTSLAEAAGLSQSATSQWVGEGLTHSESTEPLLNEIGSRAREVLGDQRMCG